MSRSATPPSPPRTFLLEPGIRLLERLRYPQKFFLIGLIFCVPLALVSAVHWREQRDELEACRVRLQGLAYTRNQSQLLRHLEMGMALTVGKLDGDATLASRATAMRRQIADDLAGLASLTEERKATFDVGEALSRVDVACQNLDGTDPSKVVNAYDDAMKAANTLMSSLADRSGLQLANDAVVYRLVNTLVTLRRLVTRRLAYLWCLTDMQRAGRHLSEVEKADIKSQADGGLSTLETIGSFFARNGRLRPFLEFYTSLDDASRLATTQLKATLADPPVVPFSMFEAAYNANWTSYDITVSVLEQLMEADMTKLYQRESFTAAAIASSLLLVLYLFAAFYASTLRTVSLLTAASRRIASDDEVEPLSTRTRDEMGEVVEAFNKVAEKLRLERKEAARPRSAADAGNDRARS